MHLLTLLAFAVLFAEAESPGRWRWVPETDVAWTATVVGLQFPLVAAAGWLAARRARRLWRQRADAPHVAYQFHQRAGAILRATVLFGFGASVFLTRWPGWLQLGHVSPFVQIFGDVVAFLPYVVGMLITWRMAYPTEQMFRGDLLPAPLPPAPRTEEVLPSNAVGPAPADERNGFCDVTNDAPRWSLRSYLGFHLRHDVLVIAVPMTCILFAANVIRAYDASLAGLLGGPFAPDVCLGAWAAAVFVASPVLLRRIWRTVPLAPGPVRSRLEGLCQRIGLRVRDILVWHSEGMMINAAVMGIFAPVRYVLLSDALLGSMDPRQVEAVFGHEAGHVRHRHIQNLLLFALVGWLLVAGLMELTAHWSVRATGASSLARRLVECVGVVAAAAFWGIGFGWLSRRFERQADLFGARCATPQPADACRLPCAVHRGNASPMEGCGRVCATGAALFASALDRVALLNGIPYEERSWRHSSIGSRIRFLRALAGDPAQAARFERQLGWCTRGLRIAAVLGLLTAGAYWMIVDQPAILQLQRATG